jgi:coiled-coil domain-containing protein 115
MEAHDIPGIASISITNTSAKDDVHNGSQDESSKENSESAPEKQPPNDPIKWFGVLVPPSLKQAQKNFSSVVESSVPRVLNATGQLRQLEVEISRTRKAIKKSGKGVD